MALGIVIHDACTVTHVTRVFEHFTLRAQSFEYPQLFEYFSLRLIIEIPPPLRLLNRIVSHLRDHSNPPSSRLCVVETVPQDRTSSRPYVEIVRRLEAVSRFE